MTLHSVNNNTRMGLVISLCSNHLISLIPPQTASNFGHFLSSGTIENPMSLERCNLKIFISQHLRNLFWDTLKFVELLCC